MVKNYKDVQEKTLTLYKIILPLLEAEDIKFIACSGTCLGACRDGGFIEGDDDMDINILPEDGDKFISLMERLPNGLSHAQETPGIHKLYHDELRFKGNKVFIDFMKLGYVKRINKFESMIVTLLSIHGVFNSKLKNSTRFNKIGIGLPIRVLTFWIPYKFTMGLSRRILSSKSKEFTAQYREKRIYNRTINRSIVYRERKKIKFEDSYIYIPVKYDEYLTINFGDGKTPVDWNKDHYK